METEDDRRRTELFVLLLLTSIVMVYGQTLRFDFILWDDPAYVWNSAVRPGLTVSGIKQAFTSLVMTHWHPLTVVAHMVDVELFGLSAGPHHGINVVLHSLNAILLFRLLRFMTHAFWPSAFVAMVWALHPLHVENVAWIADRKDLLCTLFGLLALHAYVRFAVSRRRRWYALVLLLYGMGMMSKSMIITLPIMCLLLDYWPLGRFRTCRKGDVEGMREQEKIGCSSASRVPGALPPLFIEKVPLLLVATGFSVLTYVNAQYGGGIEYYGRIDLQGRVANSICSHAWYIVKMLLPTRLAALYVHPDLPGGIPWQNWHMVGAVLLLGFISWMVLRLHRPYLIMGWLWFLGTLAPVNGLVQYGNPSRADHYMYIPMIGLLVMVGWGIPELLGCLTTHRRVLTRLVAALALGATLSLAAASWIQTGYWRNSLVFYERQMELVPDNPYFNTNMALVYAKRGSYEQAIHYATRALAIWPQVFQAHLVLEAVYARMNNSELARYHHRKASEIQAAGQRERRRALTARHLLPEPSDG